MQTVTCDTPVWASKVESDIRLVGGKDKEKKYLQDMTTNGVLDVDLVQAVKTSWQPESALATHIDRVKGKLKEAQAAIAQATPQDVERITTLQARWADSTGGTHSSSSFLARQTLAFNRCHLRARQQRS